MSRNEVICLLIEFFKESFREDAIGVGDWFAQGGQDIDAFMDAIDVFQSEKVLLTTGAP